MMDSFQSDFNRIPSLAAYHMITPSIAHESDYTEREYDLITQDNSQLNPDDRPLDRVKTDVDLKREDFIRRKAELEMLS